MRPAVPLYWRCTPTECSALLDVPGFVKDQDRVGVAEGVDDVVAQVVAHRFGVPFRPRQQMLQPVRRGIPAVFGDRPAILAVQARDHPKHQLGGMAQRLIPGESRRDPVDHRRELRPPPIRVYAVSRGDRGNFSCLHKHRTMPRSPPLPAQTRPTTQVTIYCCSTNGASPQPDESCLRLPVSWGLRSVGDRDRRTGPVYEPHVAVSWPAGRPSDRSPS